MEIVVIGGVAAGMSAASKAKRMAPQNHVLVLEKGSEISYAACGLPYYVSGLNDELGLLQTRTLEAFEAQDIDVRLRHRVLEVDPQEKLVWALREDTGERLRIPYDRLMIGSGAEAIRPNLPGAELPGVFTLKTMADGENLRKALRPGSRVVVAGGGYIGVEVAESLREAGFHVVVVEVAPHILAAFDGEVREILHKRLVEAGVEIHTGQPVQEILEKDGRAAGVRTGEGTYSADVVVMAFGVRPVTEFLRSSGIKMTDRGVIEVDRYQKTSLPDVWAAGDCAAAYNLVEERFMWSPLGTVANKCGRVAGENMAGGNLQFEGALGSAAIQVCGLQAGRTGMGEEAARQLLGADEVSAVFIEDVNHPRYYPGVSRLWVKLICRKRDGRILGGQVVGQQGAVLRCQALALAVTGGLTAHQLGFADLGYAPPFSKAWDALNIAGNVVK